MNVKRLIKAAVSIAILAYLFAFKVDIKAFLSLVGKVKLGWVLLALFLHTFGFLISGLRWQRIARVYSADRGLWFFIESYLTAAFFALFLPSRFGGDVVRTVDISKQTGFSKGISTIVYERGVGLLALVAIGAAAAFISPHHGVKRFALISGALLSAILLFLAFLFLKTEFFFSLIPSFLRKKMQNFYEAVVQFRTEKKLFIETLLLSFLLQINVIIHYWAIGKALQLPIPFLHYFYIIPLLLIVLVLPITFHGVGLREYTLTAFFSFYGLGAEKAVLFSFIDFAILVAVSIVGGVVYILRK